jgi:hypothetical protein
MDGNTRFLFVILREVKESGCSQQIQRFAQHDDHTA